MREGQAVTVIYSYSASDYNQATSEWCRNNKWKYLSELQVVGAEDSAIIFMDRAVLSYEARSRGINTLVMVTTRDR